MRATFYDDPYYRKNQSEITKRYYSLHPRLKIPITRICNNSNCNLSFQVDKPSDRKIYCTSRCAAIINNSKRPKKVSLCTLCDKILNRSGHSYCSNKCHNIHKYNLYISRWKEGLENGVIGITTHALSSHIEHYLKDKYGEKCSSCAWSQRNSITGRVPLEIDHIDGNSENNKEENLRLICPNCHSLTSSFRNLNKGKGRSWRIKYLRTNLTT